MAFALKPLVEKKYTVQNRLVLAPMKTATCSEDGFVTDKTMDWFDERTKGFGLVIVEHAAVSKFGSSGHNMMGVYDDAHIEGLRRLVDQLHDNGCVAFLQLDHCGGWDVPHLRDSLDPKKNPSGHLITDELTDEQLMQAARDFGTAAVRAKDAGFDGVQIKACHVYLLAQFFSPLSNHRTAGRYRGDTFEGRLQLTLDVLHAVREAVGQDYPVSVRFMLQDYQEGGATLAECITACRAMQAEGLDLLDLSGGVPYRFMNPTDNRPGYFAKDASVVKTALGNVPVIVTGGITKAEEAEALLEKGEADLVGVCRAAAKNPLWASKAVEVLEGE